MPHLLSLPDEAATGAFAARLAAIAWPGLVVLLDGPVGAGKSSFARAFIRAWMDDPLAEVPSPSFTLVQPYEGPRGALWHVDLYRLSHPQELNELGLDEALGKAICLIEWPDRMGDDLPQEHLRITLTPSTAADLREARIDGPLAATLPQDLFHPIPPETPDA